MPAPAGVIPAEFSVRRGYEGPQIIIEWSAPVAAASVTEIRLIRRLFGFPGSITDGDVLFAGAPAATTIADLNVEACKCYYYKLFVTTTTPEVCSTADVEQFVIPIQTGFFADKLFQLMPELYKNRDKKLELGEPGKIALVQGPGIASPEVYNFGENGTIRRGELQRFLRLFGPMLDEPKGLLDCLLNQLDVDEACIPNLAHIAGLLGLDLNFELSPRNMRNEVRLQVEFLKQKGTKPGLIARLRSVSGVTGIIVEQCERLLITSDPTRTTPTFSVTETASVGTFQDELFYTVGFLDAAGENPAAPFWLWFTLYMDAGGGVNAATFRKWCTALQESSPACHLGFMQLFTDDDEPIAIIFTEETLDTLEDFFLNEILDPDFLDVILVDEQVPNAAQYLIFNDPLKTMNADNWDWVIAAEVLP